ncbi:hypothetical protein F511_27339 [Dorcoceras hygrometricum]|uniref:Uncharacterized protein n=1 Tax=Dorcoceras hygrometricum TaxID=472368 RepID=A0A2Z7AS00_9LAMI|nr:hypothetical protein F511_27339 [Dorcoceras hygrometricum]
MKEFGQKAAQSQCIREYCSLDRFGGGSAEPDLSSAHNQSKLTRSDTVADQIGSEYSAHMLKVNKACRSIKYKGHEVQLVRRLFQWEETCVQRIDLDKGFIYQRETEIEDDGEQEINQKQSCQQQRSLL